MPMYSRGSQSRSIHPSIRSSPPNGENQTTKENREREKKRKTKNYFVCTPSPVPNIIKHAIE